MTDATAGFLLTATLLFPVAGTLLRFEVVEGGLLGDVNGDGVVDVVDLLQMLGEWGDCPAP